LCVGRGGGRGEESAIFEPAPPMKVEATISGVGTGLTQRAPLGNRC
jgi:hypothetical protein